MVRLVPDGLAAVFQFPPHGVCMFRLAAVAMVLGLTGCLGPAALGPAPVERPADWDAGVMVLAYSGFRAHSADEEQSLVPPDNMTLPRPAYCGAYQDGVRQAGDTCAVADRDTRWGGDWGPWTIVASWGGRGEDLVETEQDPSRRTVVAFDGAGTPVAWWAGARHPDGSMVIE